MNVLPFMAVTNSHLRNHWENEGDGRKHIDLAFSSSHFSNFIVPQSMLIFLYNLMGEKYIYLSMQQADFEIENKKNSC